MVPKSQVATACFSTSPPDLSSSKLSSIFYEGHKIIFLAYISHFGEIKVGLCNHHAVCVCEFPPSTFECLNQSL
jgi:hypothetical protein